MSFPQSHPRKPPTSLSCLSLCLRYRQPRLPHTSRLGPTSVPICCISSLYSPMHFRQFWSTDISEKKSCNQINGVIAVRVAAGRIVVDGASVEPCVSRVLGCELQVLPWPVREVRNVS